MYRLRNAIQQYAWGGANYIPNLLGEKAEPGATYAELWMGAHPTAPSQLRIEDEYHALDALIASDAERWLGAALIQKYGRHFPFLFKLLSIQHALSIQAHPNSEQAAAGYAAEEERGVALSAPERMYKDAYHKPELMCALTPCWAMCGFRTAEEIANEFSRPHCKELHRRLKAPITIDALLPFLLALNDDEASKERLLSSYRDYIGAEYAQIASSVDEETPPDALGAREIAYWWVAKLMQRFPSDLGVLAPLYLNVIALAPGEALSIGARTIHAYLYGNGIEIMANSDNVLRCGLTIKYINRAELLNIVDLSHSEYAVVAGNEPIPGVREYKVAAEEFKLVRLELRGKIFTLRHSPMPKILLMLSGGGLVDEEQPEGRTKWPVPMTQGASLFCAPEENALSFYGPTTKDATLYIALPATEIEYTAKESKIDYPPLDFNSLNAK